MVTPFLLLISSLFQTINSVGVTLFHYAALHIFKFLICHIILWMTQFPNAWLRWEILFKGVGFEEKWTKWHNIWYISRCLWFETLNLNGNLLEGVVPRSLANCVKFRGLDIHMLRVLVLWSNKFHGLIVYGGSNCILLILQILDLSSNNFTGQLPRKSFSTWKAMLEEEEDLPSALCHLYLEFDFLDLIHFIIKMW